ncbi:MAG: SusE domain-containing protein [Ferruginibacter sp.]
MKKILKYLLFLPIITLLWSCEKDENKDFFEGGTPPTLSASSTDPLVLTIAEKDNPAFTLSWTNPDYKFTTGLSSQNVTYTIQIDTTGSNFTNPAIAEIAVPNDLSKTLKVGEINSKLLALNLAEDMPHVVEMRIKASLSGGAGVLYSNVIQKTITPYLDVLYPVPTSLYITGAATPASWQCGCGEPELLSQKFTKVSSSKFEITIQLNGNSSYLFIPVYGSWAAKYGGTGANNSNNPNGDNFKPNGGDMISPAASGLYKITVDFKTGKFTVVP